MVLALVWQDMSSLSTIAHFLDHCCEQLGWNAGRNSFHMPELLCAWVSDVSAQHDGRLQDVAVTRAV